MSQQDEVKMEVTDHHSQKSWKAEQPVRLRIFVTWKNYNLNEFWKAVFMPMNTAGGSTWNTDSPAV